MAIRTNSKLARQRVREYIRQCYEQYVGIGIGKEFPEIAVNIMARFDDWCKGMKPTYNMMEYFEQWLTTMPDYGIGDFYARMYDNAIDVVGEILEETEEERNRFSYEKAEHLLTALMYKELVKGVADYKKGQH